MRGLQPADEMTEESSREQASAGLDKCSKVEFEKFEALNDAYKQKFGFPFVMAVRGSTRQDVLDALSRRLQNDANAEFETALAEIHKIARLRLESMEPRA
ncbi:MAG: 2-oxo-4-hydroxy-4-carboxy-5-ureidoimidazoline decarboxylase [Woeseiaceae bacterium]